MRKALVIACLGAGFSCGCSFIFVKGTPASVEKLPPTEPVECTSSKAAPIIDTLIGGYQVFRTGYALSRSEANYAGAPISRNADIGFGVGLTALFLASSIYGYVSTGQCSEAKEAHQRLALPPNNDPTASQTFTFSPTRPQAATVNPTQAPLPSPASAPAANDQFPAATPAAVAPAAATVPPAASSTSVPDDEPPPSIP